MQATNYGFRIVGSCRETRRLVDATAAFAGYATCDKRAEVSQESYLSAFQFGGEFRDHLNMTESTKGYRGLCWSTWLWWDIDRENDLDAAVRDARRLSAFLVKRYRIDDDELLIFFSGSKGFHVGLPTSLWGPVPSADFNRLARRFAERVAEQAGITIDVGIYDKVRALRAPNSRHPKTGRHKLRLSFKELTHLATDSMLQRAQQPEPFDLPDRPTANGQAAADWQQAARDFEEEKGIQRQRRSTGTNSTTLNRLTRAFLRDGAPPGDRHRLLYSAAANLAELGCPRNLAHALLTEPALDCGLPPKDVRRQIDCGWKGNCQEIGPENDPG